MSHTCHAIGCKREVPPKMFMCYPHWRQVPRALQLEVWRHYRPGQEIDKNPTREYLEVTQRAKLAVKDKEEKKGLADMANYSQELGLYEDFDTGDEDDSK